MSDFPVPIAPLYGSLYFSAILSAAFYGVTCMQTFFYYIHYRDDPLPLKNFVGILWVLDTVHLSLIISGVYKYVLAGLVNPQSFATVVPELVWELLMTTLVSVPTQGFFVYRIYLFSGKNIIGPLLWLPLGIFQLVAVLLYVGKGANATSLATIGNAFFTGLAISYCSVAAGADVLIAICLTYLLARRRIAAGFKHTAKVLQILTVFAINSGIWTAIFALLTIILLRGFQTNLIYVVFGFPLCSVYCNTLLANLNARSYVRDSFSTPLDLGADLITDILESRSKGSSPNNELKLTSFTYPKTKHHEVMLTKMTIVQSGQ